MRNSNGGATVQVVSIGPSIQKKTFWPSKSNVFFSSSNNENINLTTRPRTVIHHVMRVSHEIEKFRSQSSASWRVCPSVSVATSVSASCHYRRVTVANKATHQNETSTLSTTSKRPAKNAAVRHKDAKFRKLPDATNRNVPGILGKKKFQTRPL